MNSVPRIIVPRNNEDVKELATGLEIAVIKVTGSINSNGIPIISINDSSVIADYIENKAIPLLGGLDCKDCGYDSCQMYAKAVLFKGISDNRCIVNSVKRMNFRINEINIPLNSFLQKLLMRLILTFVETLKDVDKPRRISLDFEVDNIE